MKFDRPSAYTPFLRRFTDERAHDLAETASLYSRVEAAYRLTLWASEDAIERVSNHIASAVAEIAELPDYVPLCNALDKFQHEVLGLETTIFSSPDVDFSRPITLKEQVDLNRFLRAQEHFLANEERVSELLVRTIGNLSGGIIQSLPAIGESAFMVPLYAILANVGDTVERLIGTVCSEELADAGLFTTLRHRIYENVCQFSGVPPDKESSRPLIPASEAKLHPGELVDTYLGGTPFHELLNTPIPMELPEETRFAGHWVLAPPGRGKTTLLHAMFLDDFDRDGSIIIMDSKGDLIDPIRKLKDVEDRLLLIEPDPEYPLALNPLDIGKTSVTHAVSLLEYVFASLLEAKMTSKQQTLFRNLLPALVECVPNATLETFRDVIVNGTARYKQYFERLPPHLADFFRSQFDTQYADTRKELTWRLDFLMSNPVIRTMFGALKTRLDIGREMDAGKIILVNNSKALLGDEGAEFFGRFFISLVLAAAQQRSSRKPEEKLPCYFYIDECHTVISRDPKIATILDECRSQKIALILAHQRTEQIKDANVLSALANCGIRFANSDDEARYLADKLRAKPEFLRSLPRGTFAAFIRDLTLEALPLKIPYYNLSKLPQQTAAEQQAVRERMRRQFSFTPRSEQAAPPSAAASAPAPQPVMTTAPLPTAVDPDIGAHAEPATKWGE